jgi:hypothetical protein
VIGPVSISSAECPPPSAPKVPSPRAASQARKATAGSVSAAVSTARLCIASMPTCFFSSPYVPKENASSSASHGGRP